jgi:hypothetical protein
MDSNYVFSSHYLAPIEYFHFFNLQKNIVIDVHENFVKQSYRNRCQVLSPNGIQNLTVPVVKARKRKLTRDVKISYNDNWRKMHWKSLEAAYRSSPYFEFYEDHFYPFYHERKYEYLVDLNWELEELIIELLKLETIPTQSEKYVSNIEDGNDFRNSFSPKRPPVLKFDPYLQVFGDRNGFAPNMSIVDLLFNEGPNALSYLANLKNSPTSARY